MTGDLAVLAATSVDDLRLDLGDAVQVGVKVVVAVFLFGIALDTRLADVRDVVQRPGVVGSGLLAQFVVVPAATVLLALALDVRGSVAIGMVLVVCCPAGNVSNILTHRARGDVALSVSMTAVSNVLAIFLMPLTMAFWGSLHPTGQDLLEDVDLDALDMLLEVGLVIGVPFAAGITIAKVRPAFAARAGKVVGPVAFLALGAVIVIGVTNNWGIFVDFIGVVLVAVLLHDALALLLGWSVARATRLPERATKAMTFEVGVRNAGLGLLLVFTYFDGLGGMALVAAWWGIWDIVAGLVVAQWWSARAARRTTPEEVAT